MSALLSSLLEPTAEEWARHPLKPSNARPKAWNTGGMRGGANVMSLEDDDEGFGLGELGGRPGRPQSPGRPSPRQVPTASALRRPGSPSKAGAFFAPELPLLHPLRSSRRGSFGGESGGGSLGGDTARSFTSDRLRSLPSRSPHDALGKEQAPPLQAQEQNVTVNPKLTSKQRKAAAAAAEALALEELQRPLTSTSITSRPRTGQRSLRPGGMSEAEWAAFDAAEAIVMEDVSVAEDIIASIKAQRALRREDLLKVTAAGPARASKMRKLMELLRTRPGGYAALVRAYDLCDVTRTEYGATPSGGGGSTRLVKLWKVIDDCRVTVLLRDVFEATRGARWRSQQPSAGQPGSRWFVPGEQHAHFEAWYGVRVSEGRVVGLDLRGNNVTGSFPHTIGELRFLTSIDVSFNAMLDKVPSALGELHELRALDLRRNHFTGSFPPTIGKGCLKLVHLALGDNEFTGALPSTLSCLAKLRTLRFEGNPLLTGALPELPDLRRLETVVGFRCAIGGKLPRSMTTWAALRVLDLFNNEIGGPLPPALGDLRRLERLNLGANRLVGEVPASIGRCRRLTHLELGSNELGGMLPAELGKCRSLAHLDLSANDFVGCLPPTGSQWPTTLTHLDVSRNRLSGALPVGLAACAALKLLALHENALEGSVLEWLEGACWPRLNSLRLANNRFQDLEQCELVVARRVGAAGALAAANEAAAQGGVPRRGTAAAARAAAKAALAACTPLDVFEHVDRVFSDADSARVAERAVKVAEGLKALEEARANDLFAAADDGD